MLRSLLAVATGLVVTMLLVLFTTLVASSFLGTPAGGATTAYLAANLVLSALSAVVGGAVTAHLALHRKLEHVGALAAVLLLLGLSGLSEAVRTQPGWYPYVMLVLGPVGVLIGGGLAARRPSITPSN